MSRTDRDVAPPLTFNRPTLEGDELAYVREAVEGGHTSSSGPFAARALPRCATRSAPRTSC